CIPLWCSSQVPAHRSQDAFDRGSCPAPSFATPDVYYTAKAHCSDGPLRLPGLALPRHIFGLLSLALYAILRGGAFRRAYYTHPQIGPDPAGSRRSCSELKGVAEQI